MSDRRRCQFFCRVGSVVNLCVRHQVGAVVSSTTTVSFSAKLILLFASASTIVNLCVRYALLFQSDTVFNLCLSVGSSLGPYPQVGSNPIFQRYPTLYSRHIQLHTAEISNPILQRYSTPYSRGIQPHTPEVTNPILWRYPASYSGGI